MNLDHMTDPGITAALEQIERGGRHLVTITRKRVAEVLDALDAGDFALAADTLGEARNTIVPLAQAQKGIAVADADLVAVSDMRPGMLVVDVGRVDAVEPQEVCGHVNCDGHVKLTVAGQEMVLGAKQEMFVKRAADD